MAAVADLPTAPSLFMLRSSLRLAARALRRRFGYTLISSLGLTVALACAGIVTLYLQVETRYDTFHPGADRIGRVYANTIGTPPLDAYRRTNGLMARRLEERVSGLAGTTALHNHGRPVFVQTDGPQTRGDDRFQLDPNRAYYVPAGDGFFDVFEGFEVIHGDANALQAPGGAVITASLAERLFGRINAVGETFTLFFGTARLGPRRTDESYETLTVRAVTDDAPARSHLTYQVIYSTPTQGYTGWSGAFTYVKLTPGADKQAVVDQVLPAWNSLLDARDPEQYEGAFEPITDIHLNQTGTRYLWALGILAVVILLVAGANYTHLVAAMMASRSREVGARKALGAHNSEVAWQFILESVVIALGVRAAGHRACLGADAGVQPADGHGHSGGRRAAGGLGRHGGRGRALRCCGRPLPGVERGTAKHDGAIRRVRFWAQRRARPDGAAGARRDPVHAFHRAGRGGPPDAAAGGRPPGAGSRVRCRGPRRNYERSSPSGCSLRWGRPGGRGVAGVPAGAAAQPECRSRNVRPAVSPRPGVSADLPPDRHRGGAHRRGRAPRHQSQRPGGAGRGRASRPVLRDACRQSAG
ncbi:MAG: hypothetical protein GVY35_14360 [Bacteroidetes bacterium]|nr:hypothetical protein [Bacteroidota bacterium]